LLCHHNDFFRTVARRSSHFRAQQFAIINLSQSRLEILRARRQICAALDPPNALAGLDFVFFNPKQKGMDLYL